MGRQSLADAHPDVAERWHPTRNAGRTPSDVTRSSGQFRWWQCSAGHEWEARVFAVVDAHRRNRTEGCPICAGKTNSTLAEMHPDLVAWWHPNANGALTPDTIAPRSQRQVAWRCPNGHDFKDTVHLVAARHTRSGRTCPTCSWVPLSSSHPQVAARLHPTRNGDLTADDFSHGFTQDLWWRCSHGHEWQAPPYRLVRAEQRAGSEGCPTCRGFTNTTLAAGAPDLAARWHPTRNGDLTPADVKIGAGRAAWWVCPRGHEHRSIIRHVVRSHREGRSGCRYCQERPAKRPVTLTHPIVAALWDHERNAGWSPDRLGPRSVRRMWFRCSHGHSWETQIATLTRSLDLSGAEGCPVCAGRSAAPFTATHLHLLHRWDDTSGAITERVKPRSPQQHRWRCHDRSVTATAAQVIAATRQDPDACLCHLRDA